MIFTLNDIPVQEPQIMLQECERLGFSTESWLGKANCFVDRHGVDPSYGYFLIDNAFREQLLQITDNPNAEPTGDYVTPGGSFNAVLKIHFDDGSEPREIRDLYLESIQNITPSLTGEGSFYLIKLVDARFVFGNPEGNKLAISYRHDFRWFNKVETFLTPAQLKSEYDLDGEPDIGYFIYDDLTTSDYHVDTDTHVQIGTRDGNPITIPTPLNWEELFRAILLLVCDNDRSEIDPVFPYFSPNESTLKLVFDNEGSTDSLFPLWVPQDICLNHTTIRNVLEQLLFWSGTSFKYDGNGQFTFFKVKNERITNGGEDTTVLDELLDTLNPADVKHNTVETAQKYCPNTFALQFPILDKERENNEKFSYNLEILPIWHDEPTNEIELSIDGRLNVEAAVPIVWIEERGRVFSPGEDLVLPEIEYWSNMKDAFGEAFKEYFHLYPAVDRTYNGFLDIRPTRYLERVSWYSIGNTPSTRLESVVHKDWSNFEPKLIIPRELKLSVIIAKVDGDFEGDDQFLTFKEPRVLVGQLFETLNAYNTLRRNYNDNEEIILVGGSHEAWRQQSLSIPQGYDGEQLYFTIDDIPYLRIKVDKQYLEEITTGGSWKWKVSLDSITLVNGKMPFEDENEEEQDYLYIKNSPQIKMDDSDTFIYITYDLTAGSDIYHRWTVADAQNDLLFLKGLPGYIENPQEPGTDERRLVLKSPYDSSNPIGWLQEAADGRTDQELTQFIIDVFNDQGGGNGGGGSTFIMKALVNDADGVKSTDPTFNYHGGVVLVSDGTNQPESGSCDNTFSTPFLHNEPILLIRKNNGMWTAVKIQENIIRGFPLGDVSSTADEFNVGILTTIQGTTPTGTIKAKANGHEYMSNEHLCFKHGNDGLWHIISRYETAAIFRTVSQIPGASFNNTTGILSTGGGTAKKMTCDVNNPTRYSVAPGEPNTTIRNMAPAQVAANKTVQCKRIGRHWFIDVEACT